MTPPDAPSTDEGLAVPVLAAAVLAAASGSQLEATLHDIVDAAVRHVDATYGAMGVLTPDGQKLDRFVVAGIDDGEHLGRLPTGDGLLGLHPPMRSLGMPVRVGDVVFGNLYLTEKRSGGPFTPADEEVARALAGVAGLAIKNARLAEWAETRRRWEQAAAEMATALLAGAGPEQALRSITTRVGALTRADTAGVLAPSLDGDDSLTIEVAVGRGADEVEGVRVPLGATYVGSTYRAGVPRLIEDIGSMPVVGRRAATVVELSSTYGPALLVPLGSGASRSLLVSLRSAGRETFDVDDLDLLSAFAGQASLALELARAQQRERLLQVQADRDRIARDLHDHVVQRIFATALSLDRLGRSLEPEHPDVATRLSRTVDDLHGTIVRIRTAIFELHDAEDTSSSAVRGRLADVVHSVTDGHELEPHVRIRCDRDALPPDLVHDLVAVVRELVTNVVRHAQARRVTVSVEIADEVCVVVTDDGSGLPPVTVRSGLDNLAARAEGRGGALTLTSCATGTEIRWVVPLPA